LNAFRTLFDHLTASERALLAAGAALVLLLALNHAASNPRSCGASASPAKTFVGLRA